MSFAPGDVVVCVDAKPHDMDPCYIAHVALLREGRVYRVAGIVAGEGVLICGLPANAFGYGYKASRFRKIERADEEFSHQIRSLSPRELA